MGYNYIKEYDIKDKTDNEKKLELFISIVKTKQDLEDANNNYQYAEGSLIDYYLYQIKANQSKLDYLICSAKKNGLELDSIQAMYIKSNNVG